MLLWNCLAKTSWNFPRKVSAGEPCSYKVTRALPNLEQPFCRAHVSISSWSFDAFLVFNRVTLLCSLLKLATHKSTKEQLLRNFPEKGFIGKCSFLEELHGYSQQLYFKKLFATLGFRSSRPELFCKKGVLKNFVKFTVKHLYQCLFFNKVASVQLY